MDSIDSVSAQLSVEGEYLDSPEGTFRVGPKDFDGNAVRVPVRRASSGAMVPDADKMTQQDFNANYNPAERREVRSLIARSSGSYQDQGTRIATSIDRIRNSDDYDQSVKDRMLRQLMDEENELHYRYLQEVLPGGATPMELGQFPAQSQDYRAREASIERAERIGRGDSPDLFDQAVGLGFGGQATTAQGGGVSLGLVDAWDNILAKTAQELRNGTFRDRETAMLYIYEQATRQWPLIKEQEQAQQDKPDNFVRSREGEIDLAIGTGLGQNQ